MPLTIITFLFFTGLVGLLTWLITRKDDHDSSQGYFLAGRSLTFPSYTIALWLIVWAVGIIGSIYALFGGLRTVAVSDTLNGIGLLVGGFLITLFALWQLGDGEGIAAVYHFLGIVFAWLVILMLVIGEIWPRETEFVQEDVGAVNMTPWRFAKPAGLALIAIVLLIYVTFADFSVLELVQAE